MIADEPTDAFDLPDDVEGADRVVIYPNDAPKDPPFSAVPFYHRETFEDGTEWYDEPEDFEVTDAYRCAVAANSNLAIEDVKLTRETVAPPTPI